jgi:hypothetical protein
VTRRQRDPEVASLRRRAVASCIDAAFVLSVFAGAIGGGTLLNGRQNGLSKGRLAGPMDRWNAWSQSPLWQRTSVARAVALRNWPSLGMHLLHIHREDAHSGGPVTVRSALTRHLVEQARVTVAKELMGPWQRNQERMHALDDDVRAARRQHPDDPPAQQRAIMEVYRAAGVSPTRTCWLPLAPLVVEALVTLATPRHQSLPEWAAGIVVVRD